MNENLGDFTATRRIVPISVLALVIGITAAFVSLALQKLIGLFTHLFFFQTTDTSLVSPAGHHLGVLVVLVPVAGGLLIGFIARYGSERIRGHGIPEALESILIKGSHVEPKVALLKPISAAISIGSGGPFGAEGPIIMTGGALGSLIAQAFHLTAAERKTLLVAGAAGGMAATFGSPLAAVLLAVELLLFEWKPRSFVPVALAAAAATAMREVLSGDAGAPLFAVPAHAHATPVALGACVAVGLAAGALSAAMTASVYFFEDLFIERLKRVHWMWWPTLGGLVIGLGGLWSPKALGVGYDVIGDLLQGNGLLTAVLVLAATKWLIWSFALGSGTSGGVLAPLLMMGAALGNLEAHVLPDLGPGFWPLISMGAILGGTMRSPLTGIVFAMEITHDWGAALPLAVAVVVAHAFTVLTLKRSILTEKVSRRGYHVTREYEIDPLEVLFVRDVMQTGGEVVLEAVAHPDETLRAIAYRMASTGITRLGVVARDEPGKVVGEVSLADLLTARKRHLEEETRRERMLPVLQLFTPWLKRG